MRQRIRFSESIEGSKLRVARRSVAFRQRLSLSISLSHTHRGTDTYTDTHTHTHIYRERERERHTHTHRESRLLVVLRRSGRCGGRHRRLRTGEVASS